MAGKASKHVNSLRILEVEGRCPSWGSHSSSKYKVKIQNEARKEFKVPYDFPVNLEIDLFYESERNRPDVDNVENLIFDALKGIAYTDDKLVIHTKSRVYDTSDVMNFDGEPVFLIDLLLNGHRSFTVIRIHEA